MTMSIPDFSSSQDLGYKQFLPGFLFALFAHIGLLLLFIPVIEYSPPAAPMRIAVQVSQLREEVEPVVIPEQQVEPKNTEILQTKQILTAKNDTPPEPEDMFVLEQPPEVIEPEVLPEPPKLVPPEPEPEPEPVKVEPKKIEKVEPKPKPKPERPKPEKPKPEKPKPEKPKKVIKQPEEKPVVKPKIAEVVKPVKAPPVETVEAVKDASPVETSNRPSTSLSSSINTTNNASADGGIGTGNDRGSANEVTKNEAWKGYGQLLYAMVSKNKTYPQIAIRRHLEGTVMVSIRFEKGRLVDMKVLGQGSGHTVLDTAARDMITKAIKELPIQGDLLRKSFTIDVPVSFKLVG